MLLETAALFATPGHSQSPPCLRYIRMHYTIALILLVLWLIGWLGFKLLGVAVHILLVLAIIALIMGFLNRRKV